jgi:2-polyprenyl-6-methoxyphenol hydroxylase-like FAD-dependent oxidoreductase
MAKDGEKKAAFKVVIAGGGIAGLTILNCFERA